MFEKVDDEVVEYVGGCHYGYIEKRGQSGKGHIVTHSHETK